MCSIDLDPCTVWDESVATARTPHTCDGCGARILPGTAYLRHANLYKGKWTREAACFACWWARETFVSAHGQSFAPSMLAEMLRECVDTDRPWWGPKERLWRSLLAGILRRQRAARREVLP